MLSAALNSLVFAVAITLLAAAFCRFVPAINAATRHVIWWAVLVSFLATPLALRNFSNSNPTSAGSRVVVTPAPRVAQHSEFIPVSSATPQLVVQDQNSQASLNFPFQVRAGYLPLLVMAVWLIILVVQSLRVLSSYVYLRQIKRSGVPAPRHLRIGFDEWMLGCGVCRRAQFLLSDTVESPMAAGFRHPAVIVPQRMTQQLSDPDLDHILLHELAHLARRDDWTNLIARFAGGVFALHPIALWVLRRIDAEREIACDDWVVAMTGASKPYAASLARLAEFRLARRREMLATGIGGRRSQFGSRIERLLCLRENCDARTSLVKIAMSVFVLTVLVLTASQTPQWMVFAQDAVPVSPNPPTPPASLAAPVHAATPPRAVLPVSGPIPHPPAPPLAGTFDGPIALPAPPAHSVLDLHPAPPMPPTPSSAPAPRTLAFAMPTPPLPPSPQAAPAPRPAKGNDEGGSFLGALANAGYKDLSMEEIINLRNHGISASYLSAMNKAGWGKLTTAQLIQLRNHGVTPEYLQGMSEVGLKSLTLQDTIELANHGVRPEMVKEITSLGFGPYNVRQIIDFSNHGARPEFFRALKDAGFVQADIKDILDAVNQGMNPADLREAKQYGGNLTLRQIVRLKTAGVI
ncbi:MAG TPA: M56 family metallopeptidase [Bryobacteraceae bacterium]|nr:M56 family metallopeptidase [Bryobacteraceae bacterium]